MWLVHRKPLKKLVYNSFGIIGKFVLHEFNHTLCAFQMVLVVKNPPTKAADIGEVASIPGLGISSGGGSGNSLQNSCLENPMDRGAWWPTVHGVAKNWTQLKYFQERDKELIGDPAQNVLHDCAL